MNITISNHAKNFTCNGAKVGKQIDNEQYSTHQHNATRNQSSAIENAEQKSTPNLTTWFLRKCFTKNNSNFNGDTQEMQYQPNQVITIHNLSAKKPKQDRMPVQQKNKINLLSVKCKSLSVDKVVKIKLDTNKIANKIPTTMQSKFLWKIQTGKQSTKAHLSTSSNMSNQTSIQRLDQNKLQSFHNDSASTKNNVSERYYNRLDSSIQKNLKNDPSKKEHKLNRSFATESSTIEPIHHFHPSKKHSSKVELEDYIYQPIFKVNDGIKQTHFTPKQSQRITVLQSIGQCVSPSLGSEQQSIVLAKELDEIFDTQRPSLKKQQSAEQIQEGLKKYERSMFTIYQKNDEAFENE